MPSKEPTKSSPGSQSKKKKKDNSGEGWFTLKNIAVVVGIIAAVVFGMAMPFTDWLKSHFTSPFSEPKVIDSYMTDQHSYQQRLWGSYRY